MSSPTLVVVCRRTRASCAHMTFTIVAGGTKNGPEKMVQQYSDVNHW